MKGRPPKPAERRQGHRTRPALTVVRLRERLPVPEPPADLLKRTLATWEAFWGSPLSDTVDRDTDLPALCRLFTLRDERSRCHRGYRKARVVAGSQGQPALNPLGRFMVALDAEIRQLEDRFGLSPRMRAALGLDFAGMARSLDDFNAEAGEADEPEDPRQERAQ